MKKKFKRFGKSSLSFVLSLLMIVSTFIVGNIGSIDASAEDVTFGSGIYYYLKFEDSWMFDNSAVFYVYYMASNGYYRWVQANRIGNTSYCSVQVPAGTWNRYLVARINPNGTDRFNWNKQNKWLWNQTADMNFPPLDGTYNVARIKQRTKSDGTKVIDNTNNTLWENSLEQGINTTTATFSADSTAVTEGDEVTFTTTLASETYNSLKSVAISVKDENGANVASSDASVSDNKVTFRKAGNYRVYNEVTYNAKGFTNITDTTDAKNASDNTKNYIEVTVSAAAVEAYNVSVVAKQGNTTTTKAAVTLIAGEDSITNGESISEVTTQATVTADASYTDNGTTYYFTGWTVEGTGTFGTPSATTSTFIPSGTNVTAVANYFTGYSVTCVEPTNGQLYVDKDVLPAGDTLEIIIDPADTYGLSSLAIKNAGTVIATLSSSDFTVKDADEGTYHCSYIMPSNDITLEATFTQQYRRVYFYNRFNWPAAEMKAYAWQYSNASNNNVWNTVPVLADKSNSRLLYYDVPIESGYDRIIFNIAIDGCAQTQTLTIPALNDDNCVYIPEYDENKTAGAWTSLDSYNDYTFNDQQSYYPIYFLNNTVTNWGNGKDDDGNTRVKIYLDTSEKGETSASYTHVGRMTRVHDYNGSGALYCFLVKSTDQSTIYNAMTSKSTIYVRFNNTADFNSNNNTTKRIQAVYSNYGYNQIWTPSGTEIQENIVRISGNWNNQHSAAATDDVTPTATQVKVYAKTGTVRDDGNVSYDKYSFLSTITGFKYTETNADITTYDRNTYSSPYADGVRVKRANVELNRPFQVEVTIREEFRNKYYIKAFDINGYSYDVISEEEARANHTDGKYTVTYMAKKNESVEITPIYYYFTSDNENDWNYKGNFVTFSAEDFNNDANGNGVKKDWGGTIACYAYYSSSTSAYHHFNTQSRSSVTADADGFSALAGFPGQPMVYINGSYFMQLPTKLFNSSGTEIAQIEGITMNNYVWDNVHGADIKGYGNTGSKQAHNRQTYDYDDFSALLERGCDTIIFSFKYRTAETPSSNNNPDRGNQPRNLSSIDDTYISNHSSTNGWDVLTDYYDVPVDPFGNRLMGNSGSYLTENDVISKNAHDKLYIVSEGYYNYYNGEDYLGRYGTRWYVYKWDSTASNYSFVGALPPSAFYSDCIKSTYNSSNDLTEADIDDIKFLAFAQSSMSSPLSGGSYNFNVNKTQFVNLYNACKNNPAVITYETAIYASQGINANGNRAGNSDPASRCDGRWYFSIPNSRIAANIIIQIVDDDGKIVTEKDNFTSATSHTGTITNANAYFTNRSLDVNGASFYGATSATVIQDESNSFRFVADAYSENNNGDTYVFQGWYYNSGSGVYNLVNAELYEDYVSGEREMNAPSTFIARYKKLNVAVADTNESQKRCLIVSHDLYANAVRGESDPTVHNGSGTPYVKVEIYDSTGTTRKALYQETMGAVPVEIDLTNFDETDKVRVSLRTVTDDETVLYDIYRKEANGFSTSNVTNDYRDTTLGLSTTSGITSVSQDNKTSVYEYTLSSLNFDSSTHIAKMEYFTDTLTQGNIEIHYKYYDRDTSQHSQPMTMSTEATEIIVYASPTLTDKNNVTTKTLANAISNGMTAKQTTVVENGQEKIINSNVLSQLDNVIDSYSFWTSQDAAADGFANEPNYRDNSVIKDANNEPVLDKDGNQTYKTNSGAGYTGAQCQYHTNAYGVPVSGTSDADKWVSYTTITSNTSVAYNTSLDGTLDLKTIKSVTVWLYNTPKKYDMHIYVPEFDNEGLITTGDCFKNSDGLFYNAETFSHKWGFYNQRLGDADPINGGTDEETGAAIGSDAQCDYLKQYGISTGYVGGTITAPTVEGYDFVGWYAMHGDGSLDYKITSEKNYGYRITAKENITACYKVHVSGNEVENIPTISVSNGGIEYYVDQDEAGAAANLNVRLNSQLNVSYPNEFVKSDTNIKQYSAIIVKLPVVDADGNKITWDSAKLAELEQADVYNEVEGVPTLTEDNTDLRSVLMSHLNSITNSEAVNGRGSFVIRIDDLKLNKKGGINSFTYDVKWETGNATSTQVKLTNKNRIMFTLPMRADLYQGGSNSALMSYAAIYYDTTDNNTNDGQWILSDNFVPFVYGYE